MKKEIPILYSSMMAKAKVEMRKTQTRRIHGLEEINANPDDWQFEWADFILKYPYRFTQKSTINKKTLAEGTFYQAEAKCPYGQPGELLWGRETVNKGENGKFHYKADELGPLNEVKWTPSIHMPKEAARIWDEVTRVRVERVANISEADCIAEGILFYDCEVLGRRYKDYISNASGYGDPDHDYPSVETPYQSYRSLWQLLNGKPKAIQQKQNGKLITTSYIVFPFDAEAGKEFEGMTTWKGKPLTVVINPWVWVIESKQLSVTGKPSSEMDEVHRY